MHSLLQEEEDSSETVLEEDDKLRSTILKAAKEPLVLLVKLADRLHNMRTVYALPPKKRRAVATETQNIFCKLAERLGLFALKVCVDSALQFAECAVHFAVNLQLVHQ